MKADILQQNILELIRRTSAFLPPDVEDSIAAWSKLEAKASMASFAMDMVLQNIQLAKKRSLPICQDTGTITFYIHHPVGFDSLLFKKAAENAVVEATKVGYLRQNSVDSITGANPGNNLGAGSPVFYFEAWDKAETEVKLILKGGGCENMSTQYSLPNLVEGKKYGRDLEGVRAVILDAVNKAQGKGCAPGFLGVCIGGDRASSYSHAKKQLLRALDDVNPDPKLAELEERVMKEANALDVGPMGFSGKFTLGCCKVGTLFRLPASFYVSIAYMCWAYRRRGMTLAADGGVKGWLYQAPGEFDKPLDIPETFSVPTKGTKILQAPLKEKDVRDLKVGDMVLINGPIFTGRDAVHKFLYDGGELDAIKGGIIYHCGPVIVEKDGKYVSVAAGPTTSIREEPYQGEVIKRFGIKAVIGKGGMGAGTLKACQEHGAVYLHAIGGAAQIYALTIQSIPNVYLKQFGSPEAVWEMHVKDFPAVVTMDAHGNSLHKLVEEKSKEELKKALGL
jgi:fumarate hydratase, class I